MSDPTPETSLPYVEIDHPWVSHRHVPIYEWAVPPEGRDEALCTFIYAREDLAQPRAV